MLFRKNKNKNLPPLTKRSKWYLVSILVLFFLSAIALKLWQYHWSTESVELAGQPLRVLVARTPWQWYRGLGKRDSLGEYGGMIFVYPKADRHGVVMREMHFPIDVIWFQGGEVVDIAPNVYPDSAESEESTIYYPRKEANVVLELPAGWGERHGVKIGDRIRTLDR